MKHIHNGYMIKWSQHTLCHWHSVMHKHWKLSVHFKVKSLFTASVFWELFHHKYFIYGSPQVMDDLDSLLGNQTSSSLSNMILWNGLSSFDFILPLLFVLISNETLQMEPCWSGNLFYVFLILANNFYGVQPSARQCPQH